MEKNKIIELIDNIDYEKYNNKYVATASFKDKEVIASGEDALEVYNSAKNKGIEHPVIFFIGDYNTFYKGVSDGI